MFPPARRLNGRGTSQLRIRLGARRYELEQAVLARVSAIADPAEIADPEYRAGLRAAVAAALDYAIAAIEEGAERVPPPPTPLLAQARLAARNGVSLDTVLRRYFAGYALLGDVVIGEAERDRQIGRAELRRLLRVQSRAFDRLLAAIGEEYGREETSRAGMTGERHADRLERLLSGELVDLSELAYDFEGFHLGVVTSGAGATDVLREAAGSLDRQLLILQRPERSVWAWLGGRREGDLAKLRSTLVAALPRQATAALGEPGKGLAGWRLTHRQAAAALPIALRCRQRLVRYTDVALVASIMHDDLLSSSLRQTYVSPLADERDGGQSARETLRAYFAANCNVSSTAAALGVTRRTVTNRLRAIEERLGRKLDTCAADLEVTLRLDELDAFAPHLSPT